MTLGFHCFLLNENHFLVNRTLQLPHTHGDQHFVLHLDLAAHEKKKFQGNWAFGVIQPKLSVHIWPRMLSGISRFLALLSGVGWDLEASCSGSFCFLIRGALRSHLGVILPTAFTFWMLGTEQNHMGLGESKGQEVKLTEQNVV